MARSPEQAICNRITAIHGRIIDTHVTSITISLTCQLETLMLHSAMRQLN